MTCCPTPTPFLHFDGDRCRVTCTACGHVGAWQPAEVGRATIRIACIALRDAAEALAATHEQAAA